MKTFTLVIAVILVVGTVNGQGFDVYAQLATTIFSKLGGLFEDGDFELMGHSCKYSTKPSFAKFKLTYKGKVWCPGWTGFTGRSRTKSRSGSTEHAIKDFINQAKNNGLISADEASTYLQQYG